MDFASLNKEAVVWANSTSFELVLADESERRLVFTSGEVSFFVVCPDHSKDNFHVWSDSEVCLTYLTEVQDFITSCKQKTLSEVLEKTAKSLRPVMGLSGDSDESMEDDEDMDDDDVDAYDDDYYEMDDEDAAGDTSINCHQESQNDIGATADDFFTGDGSPVAIHRILA
ncbi:maturin-like, partial [Saccoglossus kowalevskii]|uniref:Maturin n=1 Tax=Saccoglossus kowalevskii TaxID=10224 RepID=A0ABM0GIV5_SACKO